MAADDATAAPLVFHPGEHAPAIRRTGTFDGAFGSPVEDRSRLADRLPIAAHARAAPVERCKRQRARDPRQSVRRNACRPAESALAGAPILPPQRMPRCGM